MAWSTAPVSLGSTQEPDVAAVHAVRTVSAACPATPARCPRTTAGTARAPHKSFKYKGLRCIRGLARRLPYLPCRTTPLFIGDMIMKFEALMLRGLFVACLLVCGLVLGAMVNASPDAIRLAAAGSAGQLIAPTACALPP